MTIKRKILATFLGLLAAILATIHFLAFPMLEETLRNEKLQQEQLGLELTALAIEEGLMTGDLTHIQQILNRVKDERPWFNTLVLTSASGHQLYPLTAHNAESGIVLTTDIVPVSRTYGTLRASIDIDPLLAPALNVILTLESSVVVIFIAGAIIMLLVQERWLLRPLIRLADAAKSLSEGRYDVPMPPVTNDEVGRLVLTFQDMRNAVCHRERALRYSETHMAAVIDNSAEAVLSIDPQGRLLSFNRAAEAIFGYRAEDVISQNVGMLLPSHHGDPLASPLTFPLYPGQAQEFGGGREMVALRADGAEFPIWLALAEVCLDDIRIFVATISDISNRKQVERELRESESRFRDLAGSASDWFWETDPDFNLDFVSERIGSVLGVKPSAIIGYSYFDFGLDDYDRDLANGLREAIAKREPFRDVVFSVGPEGAKDGKIIRISGIPVFEGDGEFSGYRGVGADITREALAERKASLAQQQLADAVESIVDGIVVFDANDRMVLCNREYKRMFAEISDVLCPGVKFEEILDVPTARGTFEAPMGMDWDSWKASRLEKHRAASGEPFELHLPNGRWVLSREYRTEDGGVVGVRTDITELKQREQDLDALRRRYQLILDSAGDGIVGLESDGRVTFANRIAGDLVGRSPDEMVGQTFQSLAHPGAAPEEIVAYNAPIVRACELGVVEKISDDVFQHSGGDKIDVEYLVAPILENDTVVGAVLVFRDVTLRRQYEQALANQHQELERLVEERTAELRHEVGVRARTEAALRSSRERLKGISDSLFEGVIVVNSAGDIGFANPSARRLLDEDSLTGELEGHPLDAVMRLRAQGNNLTFAQAPWPQVIKDNVTVHQDDAEFITASGRAVSVAFACASLLEENGKASAVISFRDIETLKMAQREALQSSRLASVGQLAAGIAHEINTPIQYVGDNLRFINDAMTDIDHVIAAAEHLAEAATALPSVAAEVQSFRAAEKAADVGYLRDELPTAINQSLEGVTQVARIVLSMKEFSHPGTTNKTMTDINRALESTATVSRNTWKQFAHIEMNLDPSLPSVYCHPGELNQVFLNLIINAAHAIESSGKPLPGTISITTRQDGEWAEIVVADSGTGIPDSIRDRIFDPFFTTKPVGKGTGQGLAICLDVVVNKHGGHISVGGKEGEGAVFTLRLPIGDTAQAKDP